MARHETPVKHADVATLSPAQIVDQKGLRISVHPETVIGHGGARYCAELRVVGNQRERARVDADSEAALERLLRHAIPAFAASVSLRARNAR